MIEPKLECESVREITSFVCKFEILVIDMNMIRGSERQRKRPFLYYQYEGT